MQVLKLGRIRRCRLLALAALAVSAASVASDYRIGAAYTADVMANVAGGIDTGVRYLDKLVLQLEGDIANPWHAGQGRFVLQGMYTNGSGFSDELVGDLQGVSNIDADGAWRLYQAWYQFGDEDWSVRAGLYDLNSEFDVNETGALFINSSHGIGPDIGQTGENGPGIFPVSALTLRATYEGDALRARVAIMDAVPGDPVDPSSNEIILRSHDGVLAIGEVELPLAGDGRLWAGAWRYSEEFEPLFISGRPRSNDGWYVGAERRFLLGSRRGSWFVRYGQADGHLNPFQSYLGLGAVIDGPFPGRPADRFGVAVASARAGGPYREQLAAEGTVAAHRELAWEMTYRAQLSERWALQPDIQIVAAPSAVETLEDAWVVGLRLDFSY